MKLKDLLSVIGHRNKIWISDGYSTIFSGRIEEIKGDCSDDVRCHLECEVIRVHVINRTITIGI